MSVTITEDHSGLQALIKEMARTQVEVGWLTPETHWTGDVSVPMLASHLHFYSPWQDTFMFSQTKVGQVNAVVRSALNLGLPLGVTYKYIGKQLEAKLASNIEAVTSPSNDPDWAAYKGNSKPLQWGSRLGKTPNLISSISSVVKT